jgi:hypothetical protein
MIANSGRHASSVWGGGSGSATTARGGEAAGGGVAGRPTRAGTRQGAKYAAGTAHRPTSARESKPDGMTAWAPRSPSPHRFHRYRRAAGWTLLPFTTPPYQKVAVGAEPLAAPVFGLLQ